MQRESTETVVVIVVAGILLLAVLAFGVWCATNGWPTWML